MAWTQQEFYVAKFSWLGAQSERARCVPSDSETMAAARSVGICFGDGQYSRSPMGDAQKTVPTSIPRMPALATSAVPFGREKYWKNGWA